MFKAPCRVASLVKLCSLSITCLVLLLPTVRAGDLRIGTFEIDASPPVGSRLAYDPVKKIVGPLSCKGIVLLRGEGQPIVLCAIDWLGVANQANEEFRSTIAKAVGTTTDHVVVHALHQHDAPRCDFSAAEVLDAYGKAAEHFDIDFLRDVIARAGRAAGAALEDAQQIVAISNGKAQVQGVASNRRMLGPDGRVHTTRYTACKQPEIRDLPEGVIDPWLRSVAFYGTDGPLAVLTFYATHPQSYYRTGGANPDFPGMARNGLQAETGVFHLHFNGAGGNIGAGKYNDGSHDNRRVLAGKVAAGMRAAWEDFPENKSRITDVQWKSEPVALPVGKHLQQEQLKKALNDEAISPAVQLNTAKKLAFLARSKAGKKIDIACLRLGDNHLLFMPGELFVEYQLAAQAMNPEANVLMAAYGEYGTGYIGTRAAYPQGGYEVSPRASNVAPEVELVLVQAMRNLLGKPDSSVLASDFTDTFGPLPAVPK